MKTIKQIADELGVSKQRVYRYIKSHCISEAHQKQGLMWYDEAAETLIKQGFSQKIPLHEAHRTTSDDTVIDTIVFMLQRELEIKNEQIRDLNVRLEESSAQLKDTTAALVVAQRTAETAQALHAGTISKQLPTDFAFEGDATISAPTASSQDEWDTLAAECTRPTMIDKPYKQSFLSYLIEYFKK